MGISADNVKVVNNPMVKKMSIETVNNFFFIITPPFNGLFPLRVSILSLPKKIKPIFLLNLKLSPPLAGGEEGEGEIKFPYSPPPSPSPV
jgi:hypothetical protein